MKITIGPTDCAGCGYYRLFLPFRALAAAYPGEYEILVAETSVDRRWLQADLAIFQRVSAENVLASMKAVKEHRKPDGSRITVVLEIDDNLYSIPASNPTASHFGTGRRATRIFEEAARLADFMVVPTENLAKVYARLNERIMVAPNALADADFEAYSQRELRPRRNKEFRIGYAGSASHAGDLATITKPLERFLDAHADAKFVLFGSTGLQRHLGGKILARTEMVAPVDPKPREREFPGRVGPVVMPRYYETLAGLDLDVALAPLESQVFNAGKSPLKLIEYGMMGYPVIASRFGPYRDYQELDAQLVVKASDEREWTAALKWLYVDAGARERLVRDNRTFIEKNYLISKRLDEWKAAVDLARERVTT